MNKFIRAVNAVAGMFLGCVAVLTFLVALLRYGFSVTIPDWFNLACMLQGIAIFWGIASTTHEGRHITVDGLWELSRPAGRRAIDLAADALTHVFLAALAWMLVYKVQSTYDSNQISADLGVPLWPFHLVASLGIGVASLLALLRLRTTAIRRY
jgi:TRAP-type C4-dicarboxylate transport system permease small subunit